MQAPSPLNAVHQVAAPGTPVRKGLKRRQLERQWSDEKENSSEKRHKMMALALGNDAPSTTVCKARAPLQPLDMQPSCGSAAVPVVARAETYPLIGREQECGKLDQFLDQSLSHGPGQGGCIYMSGGPGTGKTCSARASINKYRRSAPDTCVLEVNCMDLNTQRSVSGVLQQLLLKINGPKATGRSMQGLATLLASSLAKSSRRVVIVVDEVDQLLSRSSSKAAAGALSMETLFSLPRLPGAPAIAIIAIANAVDLLERTVCFSCSLNCSTLLFRPYSKDQLKSIVTNRLKEEEGGDAALTALGGIKVQLRVTQVAKESGDCRQVLSLIEEGLFQARSISEAARLPAAAVSLTPLLDEASTPCATSADVLRDSTLLPKRNPKALIQSARNDPLQAIKQLPLEQQILLATLATSKHEATKLSDVCKRYKELCRDLKQPENLGSKSQVCSALSALEHRGLLAMHSHRGAARGRSKQQPIVAEPTIELWVACDDLLKSVLKAKPELSGFVKAS